MKIRLSWVVNGILLVVLLYVWISVQFDGASTRSKSARARNDMRSMAVALEAYFQDHSAYPPQRPLRELATKPQDLMRMNGQGLYGVEPGTGGFGGIHGLTTPVAYLWDLDRKDIFTGYAEAPFAYHTDGKGYINFSPGEDRKYDINPSRDYEGNTSQPSARLLRVSYDVTNGLKSSGDLWRVKSTSDAHRNYN